MSSLGGKKAKIKDVAISAGVSPAIVSRVMNNDPTLVIRDETRKNVLRIATKLMYKPSYLARGLRKNRSGLVGIMLVDFANPFSSELYRAAQETLINNDIMCVFCETREKQDTSSILVKLLNDRQVEGLIIGTVKQKDPIINLLEELDIKYVMASRSSDNSTAPSVQCDFYKGMCLAMDHLIKLGHTHIAHISGHMETTPGLLRMKGYIDSLKKYGIPLREEYIVQADFFYESGGKAMSKLLMLKEIPSAVVGCNDVVAISALKAIQESGLTVPDDISVVGFHNIMYSNIITPSLTTVDTGTYETGRKAAEILIDLINGKEILNKNVLVDANLIVRSSTAPYINKS